MPKNKIGGSGAKKAKNTPSTSKQLVFKEEDQDYAIVSNALGAGRMKVLCINDGIKSIERIATIRGNMRKKIWINKDDLVLISLRDYQDDRCDIILKYTPDEIKMLKSYGEIPKNISTNLSGVKLENEEFNDETDRIEFDAQDTDQDDLANSSEILDIDNI
jgi:translation initiation factor 1A